MGNVSDEIQHTFLLTKYCQNHMPTTQGELGFSMKRIINFLAMSLMSIGALLCTSVPARADSITQTFSYAANSVSWENFDIIKQLVLGPGATLDRVGIYTTVELQDSLSASNKANSAQTVKRFTDQITLTDNFASYGTNVGFTGSYIFNSHTTHDFGFSDSLAAPPGLA